MTSMNAGAAPATRPTRMPVGWLMSMLMLLGALLTGSSSAYAHDEGSWQILNARYGTAERNIDVTGRLRELARSDDRVRVTNEFFSEDPAVGQEKFLRIYARNPEMGTRVFEYREGSVIDGAKFTAWRRGDWGQGGSSGWEIDAHDDGAFVILGARYGVADASIDVTGRLRELARRDAKVQVTNDLFRDDPAVGRTKTLRIYARERGGEVRVFDYREGAWIDGAKFSGWGRGDWAQDGWRGNWEGRPWGGNAGGYGPGQEDDHLHIVRALYGAHGRDADVTDRIRSLNRGDSLAVWVNDDLAGRDPAYGETKTLRVFFTIGRGPEQIREASEGERLRLP